MMRYISLFIFIAFFCSISVVSYAEDTTPTRAPEQSNSDDSSEDSSSTSGNSSQLQEWEAKKKEAQRKLDEIIKQKNTLSSQIDYMDTQIYLTELRTEEMQLRIEKTEKEIDTLENRIDGLDSSLDGLSRTLLDRVADTYKQRNVSLIEYVLDSGNANDFFGKVKYRKTAQENNQKLLFQVQQTKSNFQDQRTLRERKIQELASLQDQLASEKVNLEQQQDQKTQLLSATQNDESTYRNLIAEAERQIAGFKTFVQSTGVGLIPAGSLGTGEGGWYLSQRDSRWASNFMGGSSETILDVGCFITSISMVFRSYGYDMTPPVLASNQSFFLPRSAYMYIPSRFNGSWPGGKNYKNIGSGEIAGYLERGVPVIAGVRGASHYIVLKKANGSDYVMNDPIYGPDLNVSDYYSLSGPFGVFE